MPILSAGLLGLTAMIFVITDGFKFPNGISSDPFIAELTKLTAIPLIIFLLASGVCGLNHLFNWPKFFVPKEYRGDRGLFVSDKRDMEEANILRAEALEAIESAPPKTRKRKRRNNH